MSIFSEIYYIPDAFLSGLLLYTELVYEDRTNVPFESHLYGGAMLELFQEMYCVLCTERLSHDHIVAVRFLKKILSICVIYIDI